MGVRKMSGIKKIIVAFLAVIGLLTIMIMATAIYLLSKYVGPGLEDETLTTNSVLVLKVGENPLSEGANHTPLDFLFSNRQKSLPELVRMIHQAANDPRIKGLVIKNEGSHFSLAQIQELREALRIFKDTHKPVYAYSDTLGEGGNGTGVYYLCASAHEIWLQPRGSLNLTGMVLESYFLRGLLDDYKIKTQIDKREAYKGLAENYMNKEFSPEVRANLQSLLDDLMDQMVHDVGQDRQIEPQKFKELVDHGPYNDAEARNLKLVDYLGHYDELQKHIEQKLGKDISFISDRTYAYELKESNFGNKIALIYVDGTLFGDVNPAIREENANSPRQIAKLLNKVVEDKSIKGVILRINSPGGTVTAAETIWHEVKKVKEAKKTIIVSMGTTAASAGYQIAAPATKIVANPATITGSIGVVSGKVVVNGAFNHFNVHWDRIKSGANAGMWSMTEEFSPDGWRKLQESLDYYYDDFLMKVAEGRQMDKVDVRKVAQGQVWSGRQAKERHLVDELGGLSKAIEVMRKELGLSSKDSLQIVTLTPQKGFFGGFFDFVNQQVFKMVFGQLQEYIPLESVSLRAVPLYVRS